jgi:amino acid transporter
MILAISFGGDTMAKFFVILTAMVNVGMTIPYMFISIAFPGFKKLKNVDRSFVIFKTQTSAVIWSVIVTGVLGFANTFAIIQPALDNDLKTTFWSIAGPVIFGFVAWIIYTRYEKRIAAGDTANDTVLETEADENA